MSLSMEEEDGGEDKVASMLLYYLVSLSPGEVSIPFPRRRCRRLLANKPAVIPSPPPLASALLVAVDGAFCKFQDIRRTEHWFP